MTVINKTKNAWKRVASRFIKTKKPNETLEVALKRAYAFTLKQKQMNMKKKTRRALNK